MHIFNLIQRSLFRIILFKLNLIIKLNCILINILLCKWSQNQRDHIRWLLSSKDVWISAVLIFGSGLHDRLFLCVVLILGLRNQLFLTIQTYHIKLSDAIIDLYGLLRTLLCTIHNVCNIRQAKILGLVLNDPCHLPCLLLALEAR